MERLFYNKSAKFWKDALPLGNGKIGAMVFGGKNQETICINEALATIDNDVLELLPAIQLNGLMAK